MPYITGVSVFCPAGNRTVLVDTAASICELAQLLATEGIPMRYKHASCSDVVDIRNFALTRWYDTEQDASHLLMLDADMRWSPGLVWDMLQFDKPLTGCIYSRREYPLSAIGSILTGLETSDDIVQGFLEVESVGAGVLLIKREVVDKILARYPELGDESGMHQVIGPIRQLGSERLIRAFDKLSFPKGHPFAPNGGSLSEDLSFCYRWRECGGQVWANVHHPVSHIGYHDYIMRYADFLAEQKRRKDAGEPLLGAGPAGRTPQELAANPTQDMALAAPAHPIDKPKLHIVPTEAA